jgi:hypothetical protein
MGEFAGEIQMQSNNPSKVSIRKRATDELKDFAIIAAYLYVCFAAIFYLKVSILKAHGIEFASFGFAAIKALICAKFVSLGQIFHVGERFKSLPLIWPTLYKSLIFLILLIILNALEEITVGFIHNKTLADSLADFGGGTLYQLIATSIVGLLILIPFIAFRTLGEVVGERNLVELFFLSRHRNDRA